MLLRNAAKVFPEEGYAVVGPRLQALASEGDTDFKVLHTALYRTVQYWHLAEALYNPRHSWRHPCHANANDACFASKTFSPMRMKPPSQPRATCCTAWPRLQIVLPDNDVVSSAAVVVPAGR